MTASSSTNSADGIIPTCMPSQKDPHWFFTKDFLDNSPSRRAGVDVDKELFYRQQTASFIQEMGFEIEVDLPHTHVVRYTQKVKGLATPNKDLAQAAYFFATDILHVTTFCLRYRPSVVACVCIHLACNWAKWEIPEHEGHPWYYFVDPDITKETIEALSHEFTDICAKSRERLKIQRYIGRRPFPSANDGAANNDEGAAGANGPLHGSHSPVPPANSHHRPVSYNPTPGILSSSSVENKPRSHDASFLSPTAAALPSSSTSFNLKSEIKHEIKNEKLTPDTSLSMSPSVKKPKTEVLDLNKYKERREKERESTPSGGAPQSSGQSSSSKDGAGANVRKSFMPDISSKEAWSLVGADFSNNRSTSKIYTNPPHPPGHHSSHEVKKSSESQQHRNPSHGPPLAPPTSDRRHGDQHGPSTSSSSDHRSSSRPESHGSSSVKRPAPPSGGDVAQPTLKAPKLEQRSSGGGSSRDREREREKSSNTGGSADHYHHRNQTIKDGRPPSSSSKDRPSSSSFNSSTAMKYHLPPLPKPETNEEMSKAILNELGGAGSSSSSNPA